jgi:hypothetical protein
MIARNENVKVLYHDDPEGIDPGNPMAIILNGHRHAPVVYRIAVCTTDELANLFESGDPDKETDILSKGMTKKPE